MIYRGTLKCHKNHLSRSGRTFITFMLDTRIRYNKIDESPLMPIYGLVRKEDVIGLSVCG